MNYELAKKLKDAGFPQRLSVGTFYFSDLDGENLCLIKDGNDFPRDYNYRCIVPTLSELIEACGDKFYSLVKRGENWFAQRSNSYGKLIADSLGKTPEEAVTNLFIALNTK